MRILRIAGRNLASLAEEFSVDFTAQPLASAGLFAISGPTGAGKSTLLDALCLALYDDTPRLHNAVGKTPDVGDALSAQDPRTLLRRGAAEGWAEVDFVGNDGNAYRARWKVWRARSRAAGALQPSAMSLHRLPALQALGHTKTEVMAEIVARIGLSFEQFTRAVLLAQNEFSAFLKARDDERGTLLEALTGNAIYTDISRRAYERWRGEEQALKALGAGLAHQQPLDEAAREELLAGSAQAAQALQAATAEVQALDADLRWQRQADSLARAITEAQAQCEQAQQASDEAAPRRAQFELLLAVQPARPLDEAARRLAAELDAQTRAVTLAEQQAQRAAQAQDALGGALAQAAALLGEAEAAGQAAAPLLDQAKALDARLAELDAALQRAGATRDASAGEAATARAALASHHARQQALAGELAAGEQWLAQHAELAALAADWPRWDVLFGQAGKHAALAERQAASLDTVQAAAAAQAKAAAQAHGALTAAAERLQLAESQRQQASAALSGLDAEALAAARQQLEQQRHQLAQADGLWQELARQRQRRQALETQAAALHQAREQAEADTAEAQRANLALLATATQAERSLKLAEAACAESVEQLRASLEDGAPCPVCGATEHPYRHEDGPLRAMLAGLQEEVRSSRERLQQHVEREARLRASVQSHLGQLASLGAEQQAAAQALASLEPQWAGLAAQLAVPADAAPGAWLAAQTAAMQAALHKHEQQEQAQRRAARAREVAQTACEQAQAEHARQQQALSEAQAALARSDSQRETLEGQRIDTALELAALLDQLDAAIGREGWQQDWKEAPARFHEQCARQSQQWLAERQACDSRAASLHGAAQQAQALAADLARCDSAAAAAQAAWREAHAACAAARSQRQALWQGQAVAQVEASLQAAIEQARAVWQARQMEAQQAVQQRSRADEALAQQRQRRGALDGAAHDAAATLASWLAERRLPGIDSTAALRALLAADAPAIEAERQALQAMTQALAAAHTVLAERRARHAQHLADAPPGADLPLAEREAARAAAAARQQQAQEQSSALALQLAQDDTRRSAAAALLADIARQQAVEQRWARLSELIGSADGKRFRNYAQQFTLDVLLGYANAHLGQLAPRYQLQRVDNPAQPSLGLLVRDLHMGDELRSVHSLSGGESFLVSLGLALGLASLSSNRVRVESLFIDEGFGSLDAETLRVAMDALDNLQAMGRKVGVISHVQEMTERIATRIVVAPGASGRSAVSVL